MSVFLVIIICKLGHQNALPTGKNSVSAGVSSELVKNRMTSLLWIVLFCVLKNIELGYTLPKGLLKKVGINSTRIYVNGNNLLTWKAMKTDVIDPEQGSDLNYPITKMVNFGIMLLLIIKRITV